MKKTAIIILSATLAAGAIHFLSAGHNALTGTIIYLLQVFLAMYFFAALIAVQQEENIFLSQVVRVVSAILFSFLLFFQLTYAQLAGFIFGQLIRQQFFLSDLLALLLFLIFFFLFGLAAMVLNSFSRNGFLSDWDIYNNPKAYAIMGIFWLSAVAATIQLFVLNPYLIISVPK